MAAAAAAHHSGLWQGTVAAVADNRSSFVVVALIRHCRPNLPAVAVALLRRRLSSDALTLSVSVTALGWGILVPKAFSTLV